MDAGQSVTLQPSSEHLTKTGKHSRVHRTCTRDPQVKAQTHLVIFPLRIIDLSYIVLIIIMPLDILVSK